MAETVHPEEPPPRLFTHEPSLSSLQTDLFRRLRSAVEAKPSRRVVYCCEWLGYLPYAVYHWVEVDGQDIANAFPLDWQRSDLDALEKAGLLTKIDEWQNPTDEYDSKVTYEVSAGIDPKCDLNEF